MDLNANTSSYVLIPKQYFSRYVLTYEVLPLELCYQVNNENLFDCESLKALVSQDKISNKEVILELNSNHTKPYISLSELRRVGFITQENIDFFRERSYENYDVQTLEYFILERSEDSKGETVSILPPAAVDKFDFSKRMAFTDAVVGLMYECLINTRLAIANKIEDHSRNTAELLDFLLDFSGVPLSQSALAADFFRMCTLFNVDSGWSATEIVSVFEQDACCEVKGSDEFIRWITTARRLLNHEDVNVTFTDEGNITLRAMTLVLLNPDLENINAMKQAQGDELGIQVYQLACLFAMARTGYSFLNAEQRSSLGEARSLLQSINAKLNNPYNAVAESTVERHEDTKELADGRSVNSILDISWLTIETMEDQETVISINGIKPMAGFNLNLVYRENMRLALRIIDANGPKGMDKFKGQLAHNMLSIQKYLPESSRFEVVDKGLFLTLPLTWAEENHDLKDNLENLLSVLTPLKLAQKSSSIDAG